MCVCNLNGDINFIIGYLYALLIKISHSIIYLKNFKTIQKNWKIIIRFHLEYSFSFLGIILNIYEHFR